MARFVRSVPALDDPYTGDPVLRSHLDRRLGPDGHARARPRLAALGAAIVEHLRAAHADAESHPPLLRRYDPWGARVDQIETAAGWQTRRRAAAQHAMVALPYLHEARKSFGAGARAVQHALLHLYGPESATFSCPVAMSDGAAALLSRPEVDPAVRCWWSTPPGPVRRTGTRPPGCGRRPDSGMPRPPSRPTDTTRFCNRDGDHIRRITGD
jgi:hypothetical protein